MTISKIGLWLLWIGLIIYAFLFAPGDRPDTLELIKKLTFGDWKEINNTIIALFNLMGVLPLIYACLLAIDGQNQKIKALPFAICAFFVGAFSIIPYLALRQSTNSWTGKKTLLVKILDSRWIGILLSAIAIVLLVQGLVYGDWQDFIQQWQTSKFINVMSLDFCLLSLLLPILIKDDLRRRNLTNPLIFWGISSVPLLGTLSYLCLRPELPNERSPQLPNDKLAIDR
jgi:hypothetical protein